MMRIRTLACAALIALTGPLAVTFAGPSIGPVDARPVLYRLNDGATYLEGCFPPCRCLIADGDIRGTFLLTFSGVTGTTTNYRVTDVNWWVTYQGEDKHITGSGVYRRIDGFAGPIHEFELELVVDGGEPQRFRGGANDFDGNFPTIDGVTISANNMECYDIAIGVDASPVRSDEILRYCLGRPSNYQEGCLPPCLCPILASQPLRGSYGVVELRNYGTWIEYAVVDMDLRVVSAFDPPSSTFRGVGRYIWVSGFAGVIEQMQLALSIDGGPLTAFDSGFNNDFDNQFPDRIDIRVAMNGFYCYDIVLDIRSPRCRTISPAMSLTEDSRATTPAKARLGD